MQRNYSRSKLVTYIITSLESGKTIDRLSHEVAAYLIELGRTSDLDSIMRDAQEMRAEKYGVVELTARSAHTLDTAQVKQIEDVARQQYSGVKSVEVHQEHDDTVVGGVNVSFPHANLDITIRHRLNQIREAIS